jgi:anthranilate synthase component 1
VLLPDYKEFAALSKSATLVPVVKSVSADLLTPVSAFLAIAEREPYAFMLESVEGGEKIGRHTFLGVRPYMRMQAEGDQIQLLRGKRHEHKQGSPFQTLRELLHQHQPAKIPGLPPFIGGAVGFFAYDAVRQLESIPATARTGIEIPDAALMFYDRMLAFDHVSHKIHIIAAADVGRESPRRAYERAVRDIAAIERKLARGVSPRMMRVSLGSRERRERDDLQSQATMSRQEYIRVVERAKEYIAAGDIYQVVLSFRLDLKLHADSFNIYRALRALNPSPYMYYLRMGDFVVLGASPEMLVKVQGRKIEYRPIAGTHARGRDEAEDLVLEGKLRKDEKERAEHIMLVDLGRNDVGRVSEYGSVKVRDLMFVERYSHVMHLVSAIEGKLRPEVQAVDAFASCFPAGTLSGAPKVRAMQIIEELEPVRRGIYGGAVLYADFAGNLDSCIAIRTMLLQGRNAYLQAGAGIVADSDPRSEYEECRNKMKALFRAMEAAQ